MDKQLWMSYAFIGLTLLFFIGFAIYYLLVVMNWRKEHKRMVKHQIGTPTKLTEKPSLYTVDEQYPNVIYLEAFSKKRKKKKEKSLKEIN